jgi:hypothetical protein
MRHARLVSVLVVLAAAPAVLAQHGPGVRGGLSDDPDQLYVGGHLDLGLVTGSLRFRPNVEVGFGDNVTTVALNGEFVYRLGRGGGAWRPYLGGGPALNLYSFDGPGRDDSETEAGLNVLVGLANGSGLFFEAKLGLLDSPDLKLGVGFSFP